MIMRRLVGFHKDLEYPLNYFLTFEHKNRTFLSILKEDKFMIDLHPNLLEKDGKKALKEVWD